MPKPQPKEKAARRELTFASLTAGAPLLDGQRTVSRQHWALLSLTRHFFVLGKKETGDI